MRQGEAEGLHRGSHGLGPGGLDTGTSGRFRKVLETRRGRDLSPSEDHQAWSVQPGQCDDDTWHLVKHTNKVTGFVGGSKNRPAPISEAEVMKIVNQMQEGTEKPRHKVEFMVGEFVRIKDGPFTDFNGSVEDVNYDKSKVRVSVTIFGRATPVELDFSQIEKS